MDKAAKKEEQYYDNAQVLYNLFWSSKNLHYGFWEKGTRTLSRAIENENAFVSKLLDLHKGDCVLDAGCGVGGTCFFMTRNFGAKVVGITLSRRQLLQARRKSRELGLGNLVSFKRMDFCRTDFPENAFTKIFGVESVCHAHDKLAFLKEAHRILKPGGRIVICDGFLTKRNLTRREMQVYKKCLKGWVVDNLSHKDDFLRDLRKAGFRNTIFYDKTKEVMPSSSWIAIVGYLFTPLSFASSRLGFKKYVHEHFITCINQRRILDRFAVYGVFVAEK